MGMNKNNEHNNIELEQNNNIIKWTRIMNMKNLNWNEQEQGKNEDKHKKKKKNK
jgi:hypothetical protein